jgi:hypothetical protein
MNYVDITRRSKERAMKALALRRQGMTYREIGQHIGYNGSVCASVAMQAVRKGELLERRAALSRRGKQE